ncbi:uncharacterized protein EV422DRAFT_511387 [Fimicolochytrium jonesii]|uniref:uncharacterized protein n=1 Tax=Fimicolochytrium jonesii TaxID=1396493 RepID=UPI0022FDC1AE|nr:uncharacterized protein EV422DRAFT_511387 [Fimicolochytrium jonesii]KAI8826772.1 hypothetical protein EV422DRAFT_511387 [Fimicolochytrium jonesii]
MPAPKNIDCGALLFSEGRRALSRHVKQAQPCTRRSASTATATRPRNAHITENRPRVARIRHPNPLPAGFDPFPFDNPDADATLLLANAVALKNSEAAVKSLELLRKKSEAGVEDAGKTGLESEGKKAEPRGLGSVLGPEYIVGVLNMVADNAGATQAELTTVAKAVHGDVEDGAVDLKVAEALIGVWGRVGDVSKAVRTAFVALSAGPSWADEAKIGNALIGVLAKGGYSEAARQILSGLAARGLAPTADAYAAVIKAFGEAGDVEAAEEIFNSMREAGVAPTSAVVSALIHGHASQGRITSAHKYFNDLLKLRLAQTPDAWTGMIRAHAVRGNVGDATDFYRRMRSAGLEAPSDAYAYLIKAHAKNKDVTGANKFLYKKELVRGFTPSPAMYAAMVDAYVAVGEINLAWRVVAKAFGVEGKEIPAIVVAPLARDAANKDLGYLAYLLRASGLSTSAKAPDTVAALMEALLRDPSSSTRTPNAQAAIKLYTAFNTPHVPHPATRHAHHLALEAYALVNDTVNADKLYNIIHQTEALTSPHATAAYIAALPDAAAVTDFIATLPSSSVTGVDTLVTADVYDALVAAAIKRKVDPTTVERWVREAVTAGVVPVPAKHAALVGEMHRLEVRALVDRLARGKSG